MLMGKEMNKTDTKIHLYNNPVQTADPSIIVTEDLHEIKEHGFPDYPVAIYMVDLSNMYTRSVRWHWHEEIELILVKKGRANFMVSDESYILSEGQGIFINQNTLHAVLPLEEENCVYFSIVFNPSCIFGYGRTILSVSYLRPVVSNPALRSIVLDGSLEFHSRILKNISDILETALQKEFGFELVTKGYLINIWVLLLSQTGQAGPIERKEPKQSQVVMDEIRAKDAIKYIENHFAEPVSLSDIADSIHVSKSECCRCIKRCMKTTPFEYLMRYRIFTAARIISENNEPFSIATLASMTGFNSSSYFNKLFRKYIGCTPSEYRNNVTKTIPSLTDFSGLHIDQQGFSDLFSSQPAVSE